MDRLAKLIVDSGLHIPLTLRGGNIGRFQLESLHSEIRNKGVLWLENTDHIGGNPDISSAPAVARIIALAKSKGLAVAFHKSQRYWRAEIKGENGPFGELVGALETQSKERYLPKISAATLIFFCQSSYKFVTKMGYFVTFS